MPRKLILHNQQCPGDIVMLTAAVRDLHTCRPHEFLTDVRTLCPDLWLHNPHLTSLPDDAPDVEHIDCHYPLVLQSNTRPFHFLHGFTQYLSAALGIFFEPTEFKGDLHLAEHEKTLPTAARGILEEGEPFWIIVGGGKRDFTIKWWETARWQAVVDHFAGKLRFVQVGEREDHHPLLSGTVDLRGQTTLRELVRLVYHSSGVLCPVTSLMHLAAAVPAPAGRPPLRPCVVVAGGREPPHWEAYPGHQFLHTVGMLPCCAEGGCWRSRTRPMGDHDIKDAPRNLCLQVVKQDLPRCMDMITPAMVIQRVERFLSPMTRLTT